MATLGGHLIESRGAIHNARGQSLLHGADLPILWLAVWGRFRFRPRVPRAKGSRTRCVVVCLGHTSTGP